METKNRNQAENLNNRVPYERPDLKEIDIDLEGSFLDSTSLDTDDKEQGGEFDWRKMKRDNMILRMFTDAISMINKYISSSQ